jgi:hypothetical protein
MMQRIFANNLSIDIHSHQQSHIESAEFRSSIQNPLHGRLLALSNLKNYSKLKMVSVASKTAVRNTPKCPFTLTLTTRSEETVPVIGVATLLLTPNSTFAGASMATQFV